jgi:cell division protein FtsI (penicillin-binding protein 3)
MSARRRQPEPAPVKPDYGMRRRVLLGFLSLGLVALVSSAVYRQVVRTEYLQDEGEKRYLRVREIPVSRGVIRDRNGLPLALSAPVKGVSADPRRFPMREDVLTPLAKLLRTEPRVLRQMLASHSEKHFVYLKRGVLPEVAERAAALVNQHGKNIVDLLPEYRRYYPGGEVTVQVLGLTNTDEKGLSGIEKLYDPLLTGIPGRRLVLQDLHGRVVDEVERVRAPQPGQPLALTLDRRLQFLAYRELKRAVREHKAKSGAAVILDADTAEVLALVNQPSFNPNDRATYSQDAEVNRALNRVFEPGSTIKPFLVAAAMETGLVTPETVVDTSPGYIRVGGTQVSDHRNYRKLTVTGILTKSSNVGIVRITRQLEREYIWRYYQKVGVGELTGIHSLGERTGTLRDFGTWYQADHDSHGFGYGLSVTALQLARMYTVLASDGMLREVSLVRREAPAAGRQVMRADTARAMRRMLETVISPEGTARKAAVEGYRVAGKTGTSKVADTVNGGYLDKSYRSLFAGMIPASDPRLVMVVVIDRPGNGEYYGGAVAAPVFARVMEGAMRILNVAPDAEPLPQARLARLGAVR